MTVIIFLLSLAAAAVSGFTDETAELQQNWSALQERNIELLPVPKHLSLARPQTLTKLVISGMATARYRAAMIEELSSRISELGLQVTLSNAPEPATDAYNIILANWDDSSAAAAMVPDNGDSRFAQAYTLTPGDHRLILSGKSDLGLLYAVVTLRFLIQNDNGQAVIHPATVADWPDFATRRCGLQFNPLGSPSRRDPEEFLANMKAALKWALRHKINAISQLPYIPQYSTIRRLNAKSPHFDAVLAARLKQVTDYARANGILAGRLGNFISVAEADNPEDAADPRFKDLLLFNRRHIATWGHLDWHQEINRRYADFFRASGFSFFNHHTVDSGGANDPALWSKRDAETRRLYGDDRVKADIALWTAVADCFKGLDMDFSITQYPYSGKYLTLEGIREVLHLPDNNTARETAQKILARNLDYLNRLDAGLPPPIGFCLRESSTAEMQTFYRATPGHPIWIYWEARNSKRDVLSLLAPEIAMVKSSFQTPRQHDLKLWLSDDHEFSAQNKVLFAEYSWNCNFPGAREFSRDESPVSYPQEWLQLLAMRAATGLWGETYGPRLTALFEDMLSLAYAYDPEGFSTDRTAGTLDLPAFLARNHAALLRAESAAEAVLAETLNNPAQQRLFKGGTYAYFVDLLRMLKAAIIYSSSNQTVQQLLSLARQGELAECQVLHRQASEQLAQQRLSYAEAMEILSQAPAKTDISQHGKWALTASSYRYVSLLQPDFDRLQQHLDQTLASCDSIFTEYSIPSWYRGFCSKYFFKRISCAANDSIWRHFFAFKTFKLAPDPVEFRIRHDHEAIIFSGQIVQTDAQAYSGEMVSFKQWPVGDSACLRILPPGQPDSPVHYQIAVGNSGGACVYRFVTDPGGVTTTSPVDLGLTPEVSRTDDGWSFQLRVPFAALQAQPGKGWKVLFEYNRKDEAFSSVFSDGKYFKDTSFWQDLLFSTFAPPPCQLAAATGEVVLTEQQHSNGSGTKVTFRPALESSSPIYVKHFTAQILDADGNNLSQPLPLIADTYLPVCWKAGLPISTQLEVTQPGVVIAMEAVYLENGQEKHLRQERACGNITLAGENTPAGEATLRTPFRLDFQDTLTQKQGALSLLFKPDWEGNAVFFAGVTRKTLFHCGPPLAGETLYWKNVMVLSYDRSTRFFYLHINNGSSTIGVHANADAWDGQSFISVAATWDLTGAQPQLALYLKGEKASSEPTSWGQPISGSFPPQELQFPFSFGATNSGYQHADGAIGAIRAWKIPAAFVSQAPPDYP